MNYSLVIEPFDVRGFDYMGHFPASNGYTHILVVVDYITKWVEAIPTNVGDIAYRELIGRPMIRGKSASLSPYRPIYCHIG